MEFVHLSRYIKVNNPTVSPFRELRNMQPLLLTWDLEIFDEKDNIEYLQSLASNGFDVVRIKREPPTKKYLDRMDFPRRILFEMTSNCNFQCRMCPQQNLKRPKMDMSGELYRKVIDEIDFYGIEGLWLYHLGESLLHPEFIENVQHINTKKNLGVIWMSTNGQYFVEDKIKTVLDSNITYINFSVHSITEKTYKLIAPQGNFKTVQGNLEKLYQLKGSENLPRKPFIHCQMIEQEETKHEVDGFIDQHYKRADIVSINMLEYVNLPNNTFGKIQRERKPLLSCTRVHRNDCFVMSDGHVTLCDAAYNHELDLGDVNNDFLYEIWNSSNRKEILARNKEKRMNEIEFCRNCLDYDI